MADILKGFAGRIPFIVAWTFAAALAIGAATLFLLPAARVLGITSTTDRWSETTVGLVLLAVVIAVGFMMSATSTPLYRLLEGYSWPRPLMEWGIRRQQKRKQRLKTELEGLQQAKITEALAWEKLSRYPADDNEVAPTRLGNALRALETYALDRYGLDSQSWWAELQALAPPYLQGELDISRAATDFFVAMVYLTATYGLGSLALAAAKASQGHGYDVALIVAGLVFLFLGPIATYRLAVSSTTYWANTVQAMVNLGRVPLAAAMGLTLPTTLEEERQMWVALTGHVFYPFDERHAKAFDRFRAVRGRERPENGSG
jgi:hypothetical protein